MTSHAAIIGRLVERDYERVLRFARRFGDQHTAEDVAQEVFLRLFSVEDLPTRSISSSYLLKVAHNIIRGRCRRERKRIVSNDLAHDRRDQIAAQAWRDPDERDLDRQIAEAMQNLTNAEDAAVRLTVAQEKTLQQASAALGVRVTTVTNWKYRGLKKVAKAGLVAA